MSEQVICILPVLALICGLLHLFVMRLLTESTSKQLSSVVRFWLLVSLFFSILFYNNPLHEKYFANNSHTLFFILWTDIFIYIMLALSSTWFYLQNETGLKYYILILMVNICFLAFITTINFGIIWLCFLGIVLIDRYLISLNINKNKEEKDRFVKRIPMSIVILTIAVGCLWNITSGKMNINEVQKLFTDNKNDLKIFLLAISLIFPFFYELGIAPIHALINDNINKSILPVSHYFTIVLPVALWCIIIKLTHMLFPTYQYSFKIAYECIALLSVVIGGIGANSKGNLQHIYTYGSLFFWGCILLLLSLFQKETEFAASLLLIIYLLNLSGLYAVNYNLKSHGEDLKSTISLSGLAQTRGTLTCLLLIFVFSILGLPPLAGFLGEMNILYYLITYEKYIALWIIGLFLLWLAKAYLELIKNVYAKQKTKNFDTENKYVMFFTILICGIILLIPFNPGNIIEKMKDMYDVIWL